MQRNSVILITILGLCGVIALALYRPNTTAPRTETIEAAATIFPLYDIVRTIAGDAVDVHLILPAGASPHTYEPSPSDIAAIHDTSVIYRIGYGLDDWSLKATSANSDLLTLSTDLVLRESDTGAVDPHYFLSIPNAKHMAALATQDLSAHFPAHRLTFEANFLAYRKALDAADAEIRTMLEGVQNRNIVTMHDAWYYFAEEYGLNVIGTFEPEAAEEPTPQQLADLQHAIAEAGVHTIYMDADASSDTIASFAHDNNLDIVTVDAEGATYDSYISLMLGNARLISKNQ